MTPALLYHFEFYNMVFGGNHYRMHLCCMSTGE
jgi:hypothetical protein